MDADCPIRDRLTHLELLRAHFEDDAHLLFPDNPDLIIWQFGEDGSGEYDCMSYMRAFCSSLISFLL